MKVFVPFSEDMMEAFGFTLEDLVPFDLEYEVLRPELVTAEAEELIVS